MRVTIHMHFADVTEADRNALALAAGFDPHHIQIHEETKHGYACHEATLRIPAQEEAYTASITRDLYRHARRTIATSFIYTDDDGTPVAHIDYLANGSKTTFHLEPGVEVYG